MFRETNGCVCARRPLGERRNVTEADSLISSDKYARVLEPHIEGTSRDGTELTLRQAGQNPIASAESQRSLGAEAIGGTLEAPQFHFHTPEQTQTN